MPGLPMVSLQTLSNLLQPQDVSTILGKHPNHTALPQPTQNPLHSWDSLCALPQSRVRGQHQLLWSGSYDSASCIRVLASISSARNDSF